MKKEKILKIILCLLLLILFLYLGFLGYQYFYKSNNNESEAKNNNNHFKVEGLNFNHCKNDNDDRCRYANNTLRYVELDVSYDKIKNVTKEINNIVSEKYNEILNSNLDSTECIDVRDIYNYSKIYMMAEYLYETDNLISIAYELYGKNVCTNQTIEYLYHSYIYDIKQDKFLTTEELLALYNTDDKTVKDAISNNISYWNDILSTNYSYQDIDENYVLYISSDGSLNAFYTNNTANKTYTTVIKANNS